MISKRDVDALKQQPYPFHVACPYCGAERGEICVVRRRWSWQKPYPMRDYAHFSRYDAAGERDTAVCDEAERATDGRY